MAPPIPIIACGKLPEFARKVVAQMAPRYDVIHCCCTAEAAAEEIPKVLERGAEIKPSSGIGSNMDRTGFGPRPVLIFAGGGFTPEEVDCVRNSADICKSLTWMKADMSKFPGGKPPTAPPPVEHIVGRVFKAADEYEITADTVTPPDTFWYW